MCVPAGRASGVSAGGVASSISPVLYEVVMRPIAEGVGVNDAGFVDETSSRLRLR